MSLLQDRFLKVRKETLSFCEGLEREDFVVQPAAFVSPPKWHLGHTSWFFDNFILSKVVPKFKSNFFKYNNIFNSYYKSEGHHWTQSERGHLSRPSLDAILEHRQNVDSSVYELLNESSLSKEIMDLIEAGIHHEEQHQELLLMDIKYILSLNLDKPALVDASTIQKSKFITKQGHITLDQGLYEIGLNDSGFSYDNERPVHKVYLAGCRLDTQFITNQGYLDFINDNGYQNFKLWLSDGWDWVQTNKIISPVYWRYSGEKWREFTLHGEHALNLDSPVSHINYYEAEAFARWSGKRLPTEAELEVSFSKESVTDNNGIFHPIDPSVLERNLWTWTQSHYSPYPGYRPFDGSLSEYNGKFMCGQFVLKGGCLFTPKDHYRKSYRNFYRPEQNWMFSGIRLAEDVK